MASTSVLAIVFDCHDPHLVARFWAQAAGGELSERNPDEILVKRTDGSTPLYFMRVPESKVVKNRLHLDLVTEGSLKDELARLRELGARLVELRQDDPSLPNPDTWAVMEDPEGNEFCVDSRSTLTGI